MPVPRTTLSQPSPLPPALPPWPATPTTRSHTHPHARAHAHTDTQTTNTYIHIHTRHTDIQTNTRIRRRAHTHAAVLATTHGQQRAPFSFRTLPDFASIFLCLIHPRLAHFSASAVGKSGFFNALADVLETTLEFYQVLVANATQAAHMGLAHANPSMPYSDILTLLHAVL